MGPPIGNMTATKSCLKPSWTWNLVETFSAHHTRFCFHITSMDYILIVWWFHQPVDYASRSQSLRLFLQWVERKFLQRMLQQAEYSLSRQWAETNPLPICSASKIPMFPSASRGLQKGSTTNCKHKTWRAIEGEGKLHALQYYVNFSHSVPRFGFISLWLFFFASSSVLHCHGSKSLGFLTFFVPLFIPSRISSHSEVMPVALPTAASSGPLDLFFIRFFFKFILLQISSHFCRNIPAPDVIFYTSPMWHSQLQLFRWSICSHLLCL